MFVVAEVSGCWLFSGRDGLKVYKGLITRKTLIAKLRSLDLPLKAIRSH